MRIWQRLFVEKRQRLSRTFARHKKQQNSALPQTHLDWHAPPQVKATLAFRAQKALALPKGARIAVLNDARMNECYAALYEADPEGLPVTIEEAKLVKPADAPAWVRETGATVAAGSAAAAYPEELKLPDDVQVYSETADAVDMLEIALAAYQNGKTVPPALAAPLYVRDRVALTSEERRRGEKL